MKDQYQITITPNPSYMDENVVIQISGEPKSKLKLRLSTNDYYNVNGDIRIMDVGTKWACELPITLDDKGKLSLDALVFTKLQIVEGKKSMLEQELDKLPENRDCHIHMELIKDGLALTSINHIRRFCDDSVISENIISEQLLGRYFVKRYDSGNEFGIKSGIESGNDSDQDTDVVSDYVSVKNQHKRPAMIVVSGSDGRIEKAQAIAECLAQRGYAAFALCYFGMAHVPDNLDQIPMEYIEEAIQWLKARDEVDPDRIGIYGRSKGGEMVLLAGTLFPDLKCVIANTPSNYIQEGLIGGSRTSGHSSWSYKDKEFPFIKASMPKLIALVAGIIMKKKFVFRKFYQNITWKNEKAVIPKARIKIEETNVSYLFVASDTDGIWPSDLYSKEATGYMNRAGKQNQYRQICYEKSGHMLTLPYQPIPNCMQYGGVLEYGVRATIDAWNQTLKYLTENL